MQRRSKSATSVGSVAVHSCPSCLIVPKPISLSTTANINVVSQAKSEQLMAHHQEQVGCKATTAAMIAPTVQQATADTVPVADLRAVFVAAAVPMIGFGFMDQFVLIQAGGYIDATLGVSLGLATLTAAAAGKSFCRYLLLISTLVCRRDVAGVVFGDVHRYSSFCGFK
jgi:Transmembrane protein 65